MKERKLEKTRTVVAGLDAILDGGLAALAARVIFVAPLETKGG